MHLITYFCNSFYTLFPPYTNLPHFLSLKQFFSCFLQLVPSISSSVDPVYVFYLIYVPSPSSKLIADRLKTSPHHPIPFTLASLSDASFNSNVSISSSIPLVQLYTTHRLHRKSFCFSQNSYFIFFPGHLLHFIFSPTSFSQNGPDGRCFLAAWAVSKFVHCRINDRPKSNLPKRKGIHPFRCSVWVC